MTTKGFESADVQLFSRIVHDWNGSNRTYAIKVCTMGDTIPRCIFTVYDEEHQELFWAIFDHARLDDFISLFSVAKSALDVK